MCRGRRAACQHRPCHPLLTGRYIFWIFFVYDWKIYDQQETVPDIWCRKEALVWMKMFTLLHVYCFWIDQFADWSMKNQIDPGNLRHNFCLWLCVAHFVLSLEAKEKCYMHFDNLWKKKLISFAGTGCLCSPWEQDCSSGLSHGRTWKGYSLWN